MSPATQVKYKRCPQCGTVVLMTMAICPVCDRHFQTTAPYATQMLASQSTFATSSPYTYSASTAYGSSAIPAAHAQTVIVDHEAGNLNWTPIAMAALCLPWLGMILNHQFTKGMAVLAATAVFVGAVVFFGAASSPVMLLTAILAAVAGYVIGLLDVVAIAQRYGRGEDVREWDWF